MTEALAAPNWSYGDFSSELFVGYDFDGTIARTFDPSPRGVTVASAYDTAVDQIFGVQSLAEYHASGGLRNRAPVEIVRQLAPDATTTQQADLVAMLDDAKLAVLLEEITAQWPQPTDGYLDFIKKMQRGRENGARTTEAIISSGHAPFITQTYKAWGVPEPEIILAQEAIAAMANAENLPVPAKPSTRIMRFAHTLWRDKHHILPTAQIPVIDAARMSYVGDDKLKDGEMASQSNVVFYLLDPANSQPTWNQIAQRISSTTFGRRELS